MRSGLSAHTSPKSTAPPLWHRETEEKAEHSPARLLCFAQRAARRIKKRRGGGQTGQCPHPPPLGHTSPEAAASPSSTSPHHRGERSQPAEPPPHMVTAPGGGKVSASRASPTPPRSRLKPLLPGAVYGLPSFWICLRVADLLAMTLSSSGGGPVVPVCLCDLCCLLVRIGAARSLPHFGGLRLGSPLLLR
jgi:hypothetical protein